MGYARACVRVLLCLCKWRGRRLSASSLFGLPVHADAYWFMLTCPTLMTSSLLQKPTIYDMASGDLTMSQRGMRAHVRAFAPAPHATQYKPFTNLLLFFLSHSISRLFTIILRTCTVHLNTKGLKGRPNHKLHFHSSHTMAVEERYWCVVQEDTKATHPYFL